LFENETEVELILKSITGSFEVGASKTTTGSSGAGEVSRTHPVVLSS
jgi:hypothetical protein